MLWEGEAKAKMLGIPSTKLESSAFTNDVAAYTLGTNQSTQGNNL
jgi:hypothetical protein